MRYVKLNDYKCAVCAHIIYDHQGETPPRCPECAKKNKGKGPIMWKHYRPSPVHYKGSGFTGAQKEER